MYGASLTTAERREHSRAKSACVRGGRSSLDPPRRSSRYHPLPETSRPASASRSDIARTPPSAPDARARRPMLAPRSTLPRTCRRRRPSPCLRARPRTQQADTTWRTEDAQQPDADPRRAAHPAPRPTGRSSRARSSSRPWLRTGPQSLRPALPDPERERVRPMPAAGYFPARPALGHLPEQRRALLRAALRSILRCLRAHLAVASHGPRRGHGLRLSSRPWSLSRRP